MLDEERDVLFVADFGKNRVMAFDTKTLHFKYQVGHRACGFGELHGPRGLAVHGGELFITEAHNNRLHVFSIHDSGCTFSRTIGCRGRAPGQFHNPFGLVVHEQKLVVTEYENPRVQVLTRHGAPKGQLREAGFGGLLGICVDPEERCALAAARHWLRLRPTPATPYRPLLSSRCFDLSLLSSLLGAEPCLKLALMQF